jgi:hypothetical protein
LLDDDRVLMNTRLDRAKARDVDRDPRVSLCYEDGYQYVTLEGRVTTRPDPDLVDIETLRIHYADDRLLAAARRRVSLLLSIDRSIHLSARPPRSGPSLFGEPRALSRQASPSGLAAPPGSPAPNTRASPDHPRSPRVGASAVSWRLQPSCSVVVEHAASASCNPPANVSAG